jgi:hypothetical protein
MSLLALALGDLLRVYGAQIILSAGPADRIDRASDSCCPGAAVFGSAGRVTPAGSEFALFDFASH